MLINKNQCTGCGSCLNICHQNAISMIETTEGFLYPKIDNEKCTQCGLCNKTCPVIKPKYTNFLNPKCYAVMANDEIRNNGCSSGGIFPLLAKYYFYNGWYVSGAKFLEDGSLQHIVTKDIEELKNLVGSKYLQSTITDIYKTIKDLLENNERVLFSGTPCQIAGLKTFLQNDYANLLTLDIVCHGVPSPKVFKKYINEEIIDAKEEKWINTNFRDKVNGWNPYLITSTTTTKQISTGINENIFMQAFLDNYCLRESCSDCKFAKFPRQGDLTIGDFWGIDNYNSKLNDQKGTSLLLINSNKGMNIINKIKSEFKLFEEVPLTVALNGNWNLVHSSIASDNRKLFFELLDKKTLKENIEICKNDKCDYLIVNFWWSLNYGAALTAWAMQELLKSFNLVPKILNIKDDWVSSLYKNSFSENFAKKYLDLTKEMTLQDAKELSKDYKGVITGSDQVFRLEYINESNFKRFFLNFLMINCRKIALSASFGISKDEFCKDANLTEEKLYKLTKALNSFDYLSCRELSGQEIYKDVFGLNSEMLLDPVFLINKEKYKDIMEASDKNYENKIVTYILDDNKNYIDVYNYIERQLNKPIVKIKSSYKDKNLIDVADWIKAFYDTDFIITDSYHGVCFSIIFNKPFICIKNKKRGTARFDSLIEIFNIGDNFISSINEISNKTLNLNMDYTSINKILEQEKKRCITRIKDVLLNNYSNNTNAKLGKVINYISNQISIDNKIINTKFDEFNNKLIHQCTNIDELNNKLINQQANLKLYFNSNKIYRKYYRYKLLSKIMLGKKRKHYKEKAKIYHKKVRQIRKIKKEMF